MAAMNDVRIDSRCSIIVKIIYEKTTFQVKMDGSKTEKLILGKDVRQGDTISPRIFTLALVNALRITKLGRVGFEYR